MPKRWVIPLILMLGLVGFAALHVLKPKPSVQPATRTLPLVKTLPILQSAEGIALTASGLVRPRHELIVAAEVAGRVAEISPQLVAGGRFRQAERLISLDRAPFELALAQAQAELASAQAAYRLSEQLFERTEELIAKGFLSRQTLDERASQKTQAQANLARAQALVNSREIDLRRTELNAPFSGLVLSQRVSIGEIVQPGRELARVFPSDLVEITVSMTDREVALLGDIWRPQSPSERVKRGKAPSAEISIRHGTDELRWPARIDRVEAAVDPNTRTFNVVIAVDDPWGLTRKSASEPSIPLLVGMYAQVHIQGLRPTAYAKIPRRALRDGNTVWLLDEEKKIQIKQVPLIYETQSFAFIGIENLPSKASLVISDLKVVAEGMLVRTQEEERQPTSVTP